MVACVTHLTTPPQVGRLYSVPTVSYPWLFSDQLRTWPVFLPRHADDLLDFPHEHFHVDPRFLNARQVAEAHEYLRTYFVRQLYDGDALGLVGDRERAVVYVAAMAPISRGLPGGGQIPMPPTAWRTLRCTRDHIEHPAPDIADRIQGVFAGRRCRKVRTGWVCPHQGFPLGSVRPRADGVVVCPLHGLRIDAATPGASAVSAAVHVLQSRTGRITGSYDTRAGERVWIIDWDDGALNPLEDIEEGEGLKRGCRVQLAGGRLERVA